MAPSIARQSIDLRLATFRLARRLRSELSYDALSDAQFGVLALLNRHGPLTLTELAQRERVSTPSMNRTVNVLEDRYYVRRVLDTGDRRRSNLLVTEIGAQVVADTLAQRDAWLTAKLRGLDPQDREVLAQAATIMERFATE